MFQIYKIIFFIWLYNLGLILTCPEECQCTDDIVNCSGKGLSILPEDIDPEIQTLDLTYNVFTSVPRDLQRITNLRDVILAHNRIDALDAHLEGLSHLEVMDLSWNTFIRAKDIHQYALRNLTSLKSLDLSHNTLETFPECENPTLQDLLLRNCSINALNPGVLRPFPNLRNLDVSMNNFSMIGGQFASKTLEVFNLTECGIQQITHMALSKLKALVHLDLRRNYKLKSFDVNSSSLQILDLSDCNLESVPKGPLPNLMSLNLNGNHIRRLESKMLETMNKVEVIYLSNNAIDYVAFDSFEGDYVLRELDMSYNTIRTLDENIFKYNFNLTKLNLGRNYLDTMIPFQSSSLVDLDLSNCEITDLKWYSLKGMTHLKSLYLSWNYINSIPVNLTSSSLMWLNLSNNRLTSIRNTTFVFVPNLVHLNVVGNRLVQLQFYPSFKNIRSFFLEDNPWRCECSSKSFKFFYETLSMIKSDVDIARCTAPFHLEGKTWAEACSEEWFPWDFAQADKAWMGSVIIMAVFALVCCLFVGINKECTRRKKRQREIDLENQQAARDRLMNMIEAATTHLEEENRNAPDPRESLGPPSYTEAITMAPLGSTASLYSRKDTVGNLGSPSINGSMATSLNNLSITTPSNSESRSRPRRKKRSKSAHRLSAASQSSGQISSQLSSSHNYTRSTSETTQSNPDLLDKSGRPLSAKAKRRRKRSQTRLQNMPSSSDSEVIETDM